MNSIFKPKIYFFALLVLLPLRLSFGDGCLPDDGGGSFYVVKQSYFEWIGVASSVDDCSTAVGADVLTLSMAFQGFDVGRIAPIWSGASDPAQTASIVTVNPPPSNMDGIAGDEMPYTVHSLSLKDIGTYRYLVSGTYFDGAQ